MGDDLVVAGAVEGDGQVVLLEEVGAVLGHGLGTDAASLLALVEHVGAGDVVGQHVQHDPHADAIVRAQAGADLVGVVEEDAAQVGVVDDFLALGGVSAGFGGVNRVDVRGEQHTTGGAVCLGHLHDQVVGLGHEHRFVPVVFLNECEHVSYESGARHAAVGPCAGQYVTEDGAYSLALIYGFRGCRSVLRIGGRRFEHGLFSFVVVDVLGHGSLLLSGYANTRSCHCCRNGSDRGSGLTSMFSRAACRRAIVLWCEVVLE